LSIPRKSRDKRIKPIVGGLLVAIVGVGLTVVISRNQPATSTTTTGGSSGATTNVLIARMAIAQSTIITLADLTTAAVPSGTVPASALTAPSSAAGDYAAINIPANTVIVPSMLATAQAAPAAPINPITIANGDVAIAIPSDPEEGAGGYIQQGDHIDILVDVTGQGAIKYAFQDVLVLRAGSAGSSTGAAGAADILLVELPRRQAEEMALILAGHGTPAQIVRYALRPAAQSGAGYLSSGADLPPSQAAVSDAPMTPQLFNSLFNK
jgi:Flp pilus assembly protein CpaB